MPRVRAGQQERFARNAARRKKQGLPPLHDDGGEDIAVRVRHYEP